MRRAQGAAQFVTFTEIEVVPSSVALAEYALAEIVCAPSGTVVEFQLNVSGGVEAK